MQYEYTTHIRTLRNTLVYRHRRDDTNEVFYVGIGSVNRSKKTHGRNAHWFNIVNKTPYSVEIIAEDLTWGEAAELECLLISEYGRKDLNTGCLVNMTDGGEGCLGRCYSEDTKNKISNSLKDKWVLEEHYLSGDKHHAYGNKSYNIKSLIDVVTGKVYESIKLAAEELNYSKGHLSKMLRGKKKNKTNLEYL